MIYGVKSTQAVSYNIYYNNNTRKKNSQNMTVIADILRRLDHSFSLSWKTFNPQDIHWYYSEPHAKLKDLNIPTFIIYGDRDSDDIKKIGCLLSDIMPNVKTDIMKNTDHLINFEEPAKLNKLILDFLSKIHLY